MEWIDVKKKPNHLEEVEINHWIPFRIVTEKAIYYSDINCYKLSSNYYAKQVESWRPLQSNLEKESNTKNNLKFFWE